MMTGAADLHHVNLGRVLALLAAILAALRRRTTARRARALALRLFVSHFRVTSFNCSSRSGNVCVSQVSTRDAAKVKPKIKDGRRKDERKSNCLNFRLPSSAFI